MKGLLLVLLFTFAFSYTDLEALTRVVHCEVVKQEESQTIEKLDVASTFINRSAKSGKSIEYEATISICFLVWNYD